MLLFCFIVYPFRYLVFFIFILSSLLVLLPHPHQAGQLHLIDDLLVLLLHQAGLDQEAGQNLLYLHLVDIMMLSISELIVLIKIWILSKPQPNHNST